MKEWSYWCSDVTRVGDLSFRTFCTLIWKRRKMRSRTFLNAYWQCPQLVYNHRKLEIMFLIWRKLFCPWWNIIRRTHKRQQWTQTRARTHWRTDIFALDRWHYVKLVLWSSWIVNHFVVNTFVIVKRGHVHCIVIWWTNTQFVIAEEHSICDWKFSNENILSYLDTWRFNVKQRDRWLCSKV